MKTIYVQHYYPQSKKYRKMPFTFEGERRWYTSGGPTLDGYRYEHILYSVESGKVYREMTTITKTPTERVEEVIKSVWENEGWTTLNREVK